jgi:hypothetical protein
MSIQLQEVTHVHTRLLKCALEIEDSRAYWAHTDGSEAVTAQRAFDLGTKEYILAAEVSCCLCL